jgi:hypothetical protein
VPTRKGSSPDAPDGGHITQCGATLDAAAGEAVADDAPPPAAAVDLADAPGEADVPPLVADVVVAVDDVADVVVVVVAAIAGSLTAPDDPLVRAVPATPDAVAEVCAAPGPASATSSGRTIRTIRNSWAMTPSDPNLMPFMRLGARRSSPRRPATQLAKLRSAPPCQREAHHDRRPSSPRAASAPHRLSAEPLPPTPPENPQGSVIPNLTGRRVTI